MVYLPWNKVKEGTYMPHSGGGGSHGGGGHGGSHGGGSSVRTSHHYFHGARRYRRRYRDGREEYFYSNGDPRKNGLSGLIMFILFGGVFGAIMFVSIMSDMPRRLTEEYNWPETRVIDNIDVISEEDEAELEDVLEEYNDVTGICPIIYTMNDEDYEDYYVDLESFAYQKYVNDWEDEQHFLIVYTIPEAQTEDFRSGTLRVPDYSWEIMQGDDTDPLFTESVDNAIVEQVQENFEAGKRPGPVFTALFKELKKNAEEAFEQKFPVKALPIFFFVGLFFLLPIILMIRTIIKERGVEYEEVPLTEEDRKSAGAGYGGSAAVAQMSPQAIEGSKTAVLVVMAIFGAVGLIPLFSGIATLASGSMFGLFSVGFGVLWVSIIAISAVNIIKNFNRMKKNNGNPLTAEYPKADYPHAEYPKADYPDQAPTPVQSNPIWQTGTSYHPEDDEDDLSKKGFE